MSSSLYRLGRSMASTPWRVIAAWIGIAVLCGAIAVGLAGKFTDDLQIPSTEAQNGLDMLDARFPEMGGVSGQFVFTVPEGENVDQYSEEIAAIMGKASEVDGVAAAPDPFDDASPGTRNDDESAIIGSIQMDGGLGEFPATALDDLTAIAEEGSTADLEVHAGGQVFTQTTVPLSITEVLGVIFALIVLAITFRSIVPAFVPILTAITGVGTAMAALIGLAAGVTIPSVTPTLAIMLGLAVGIDYALFIVSRHRDQLAEGLDVVESIGRAIATSGSAVIFAGATVIIALVGLFVTGIPFLTLMGLASAFTVALAVVIALTLLPAMLGLLGERLRPRTARGKKTDAPAEQDADSEKREHATSRWVRLVTEVPALTIVLVLLAIGGLALPAKDLRLGLPDLGTEPEGTMVRETYDLITEEFGAGYNNPLLVTADIINSDDPLGVVDDLENKVTALDHVEAIQLATPNRGADLAVIVVIPEEGQTDQSTVDLVHELRDLRGSWESELDISDVTVTGQTAAAIDITQKLSDALLPFAVFVVGLSLILLTIVFRSLWVPIKASVGYLLSIGAAFGVVTMVFEYGWGNAALNINMVGPVISFMPIIVMGVLFGLAMDYEVFLVSRMREDYVHTGEAKRSVITGFNASAAVVIAAALIMIAVFASFIPESTFMIQPIALGLAIGVLVDAFVVRMTLVPAVLALLGDRAWHLPDWLDRVLPHLDVEGEGLTHVVEHREWTQSHGPAAVRLEDAVIPLIGEEGRLGPLTGAVSPGSVLILRSTDDAARRTLLSALAGRAVPASGVLAVHDSLSPDNLSGIQARVHWLTAGTEAGPVLARMDRDRLGRQLIVVEDIADLVRTPEDVDAPDPLALLDTVLESEGTLVVGSAADDATEDERILVDALADPSRASALAVSRSTEPDDDQGEAPATASDAAPSAQEGALA